MVSDWQGGDISKLFPALSGKEDLSMGEDKKADKKRKRIVPKAPVQMISYLQNGGQQCPLKIVRCAALNMSRALVHQGIVLLVPRRYGGRNQTRANAGAENRKG